MQKVYEREGDEGVQAAVDALNARLNKDESPCKVSIGRDPQTKAPFALILEILSSRVYQSNGLLAAGNKYRH